MSGLLAFFDQLTDLLTPGIEGTGLTCVGAEYLNMGGGPMLWLLCPELPPDKMYLFQRDQVEFHLDLVVQWVD